MGKIAKSLTIAGAVLGLAFVAPAAPALAASSTSTGVVNPTKEQPWYQQYQATPLSATIDINYVPGYGVAVWTAPVGGHTIPGKLLMTGTKWKTVRTTKVNGTDWYDLGGNQWIAAPYAHVYGAPNSTTEVATSKVATINYVPGYSIAVWTSPNNGTRVPGKMLKHGTAWRVVGTLNNGELWYDLGGHQWIQARYTK
jgi:hypothetical protein